MNALEKYYYEYLMDYSRDANFEGYDLDQQLTRNRVEEILSSECISQNDIIFLYSLLEDIENSIIRKELKTYFNDLKINMQDS